MSRDWLPLSSETIESHTTVLPAHVPRVPQGTLGTLGGSGLSPGSYLALPVGRQVVHVRDVHQLDEVAGQRRPDVTWGAGGVRNRSPMVLRYANR